MANGNGQCIGGVIRCRTDLLQLQQLLQHLPNLFFIGIPVPGDGLLHFFRGIFIDGQPPLEGRSDGNPLGPAQFEHALNVLAEKRGFDGKAVGAMGFDQLGYFFMDELQPGITILDAGQFEAIHDGHCDALIGM